MQSDGAETRAHSIRLQAEPDAVLRERTSGPPYPSRIFWVHESLEPIIRRMWHSYWGLETGEI
jgi:hypothetical protein